METLISRNKVKRLKTLDGSLTPKHIYDDYLKLTPDKYKVSLGLFLIIIKTFMKYVILDIIRKDIVFKLPFNIGTIQSVKKYRNIVLTDDGDIDYEKSTLIKKRLYDYADRKDKNNPLFYDITKKTSIWYKSKMGYIKNKSMFYIKLNSQLWKDR